MNLKQLITIGAVRRHIRHDRWMSAKKIHEYVIRDIEERGHKITAEYKPIYIQRAINQRLEEMMDLGEIEKEKIRWKHVKYRKVECDLCPD